MDVLIRALGASDHPHLGRIFFCAVHEGTRHVYDLAQRRAWAGDGLDPQRWHERLAGLTGFVAEAAGEPLGFMTIDGAGYVDLAFVLPSAAGRGLGGRLLQAVEAWAKAEGVARLTTAASLAARPFFARHGWQVVAEEEILRQSIPLRRFQMDKRLES